MANRSASPGGQAFKGVPASGTNPGILESTPLGVQSSRRLSSGFPATRVKVRGRLSLLPSVRVSDCRRTIKCRRHTTRMQLYYEPQPTEVGGGVLTLWGPFCHHPQFDTQCTSSVTPFTKGSDCNECRSTHFPALHSRRHEFRDYRFIAVTIVSGI